MSVQAFFPVITEEEMKLPFYVKSVGINEDQEHIYRPNGYSDFHWLHCIKGSGKLLIENKEFYISKDMGFFFYPNIPHEYFSINEPWETHWVTFSGYGVDSLLKSLGFKNFELFTIYNMNVIELIINDLLIAVKSSNSSKGFECSTLLYKFIIELRNFMGKSDSRLISTKYNHIEPVIDYIDKNYNKNLSLSELAAIVNVTPQHLCRLFKETFNMRPFAYITKLRIQKAKEFILSDKFLTMKEICSLVGYNDVSYFGSTFKEYEGITPINFKKMHHVL